MLKINPSINKILIAILMILTIFIGIGAQAVEEKILDISYGPSNDAPETYVPPAVIDSPVLIKEVHLTSVSPTTLTATLAPGESTAETKIVSLDGSIPKADVVFSFDLTGSMGGSLSAAQAQALDIMEQLDTVITDANYGVVSYMDYTSTYSSFGYSDTYGSASSGDYPYALNQSVTSNRTAVMNAINNLNLGFGYDGPEDYTRVFYESYADTRIGWRTGAKRIFVNFADNVPHDNNLYEGIPEYAGYGIYSTGGDPGRDEVMDVTSDPSLIGVGNDDLDLQQVLAGMKANNVILLEVHSSTYSSTLWNNWVNRTGGALYQISSSGTGLANAIINLVNTSASKITTLSLETVPTSYAGWVSATPESYTNFTVPSEGVSKSFAVTVTPPAGTLPGVYNFKIKAIADGGLIGEQDVSIKVTGVTGRAVKIQTNYTIATINGTKEVSVELINASDVAGGTFKIDFDPTIVTVESVGDGDFYTPTANIDNVAGTVTIAVARLDAVGTNSSTLAKVIFKAVAIGSSDLDVRDSVLNNAGGTLLTPTEYDGKITIGATSCGLNGDLNGNGILDTGDATLLLRAVVGLD